MAVESPPTVAALADGGVAENGGVWLSWRAYGEGEPVLMIMGYMGSSKAWFRLLPHVSREHRAIVFDNRGTGDSDRPPGLWSMDDLARDALAVLDAAGHDPAHVLGVSMGGMVAQHLALGHPERVRTLTLCCTQPGGRGGAPPWRMLASIVLRPLLGPGATFPIVAPLLYSERTRRDRRDRLREDLEMRWQERTPAASALSQSAAIARHDTRARLAELSMPVLVLHGTEDALIPASAARELASLIPRARLVLVPGAGHVIATDAEDETASALLDFLASHAES